MTQTRIVDRDVLVRARQIVAVTLASVALAGAAGAQPAGTAQRARASRDA